MSTALEDEIAKRFGVLPNFFRLASNDAEITKHFWGFAQFAYLDNPWPSIFKERLFVYLSRFCETRYCIARHVGFLVGSGYPAGDSTALPQTVDAVLPLLRRPLPHGDDLTALWVSCGEFCGHLDLWPEPDSLREQALFAAVTHLFLQTPDSSRAHEVLFRALGPDLERLKLFLAFVSAAHYWTRLHPDLAFEDEIVQLLAVHETLAELVLSDPAARMDTLGGHVAAELASLQKLRRQNVRVAKAYGELRIDFHHLTHGLHETDETLRELVSALPAAVYACDRDGAITYYNRQAVALWGGTPDLSDPPWSFPGPYQIYRPDGTLLQPEEIPIREVCASGRAILNRELLIEGPDRSRLYVLANVAPVHDSSGMVRGAINIFQDITERKEAELRVLANEARHIEAERLAKVGSWEQDETGAIRWSNELFRILGVPAIPADSKSFLNHVHPADRMRVAESIAATRTSPVPCDLEYRFIRPDGEVRFIRSIAEAIRNEQGTPVRFVGAFQDVTEQVKASELLRKNEERLKSAERLTHAGNWQWDIKANQVSWSEGVFQIFGRPKTYVPTYQEFLRWVVAEDRGRIAGELEGCLKDKKGRRLEFQIARPNGELRSVNCISEVFVDDEGSPIHMFGACQDVTDARRAQEESIARQKLETVGTLASGVAHDFNNLLGGVLAQAELALAELAAGSRPEEELKTIRDTAIRGSEIVHQLMVYAGKESEALVPIDVSRVVREMIELLRISASKHATLEIDLARDLPAVRASTAQISQIAMNLVANASEAIGDREGVIRVATRTATVTGNSHWAARLAEGRYLQLEVSDTGCGMPPEMLAKVFEPFFSTKSPGRGLGLAVIQGTVRSLHGAIYVESEQDKGTTFQILLPCVETATGSHPDDRGHPHRTATILVAEDEDSLRKPISKLMRNTGFTVIEARDGVAALEAILDHKSHIDILLLDVTLPGTPSGEIFETAKRVRPEMCVIITSAYTRKLAEEKLRGRIERFLRKPYRLNDLIGLVRPTLT
jgi:PAS domain S-box-containing protein